MTRRLFLAVATAGLVAASAVVAQFDRLERAISRRRRPQLDGRSPIGKLAETEMNTIMALIETLIPVDDPSDQMKRVMAAHIDHQTTATRGYFKEYRSAVILLNDTAEQIAGRKPFAELNRSDRHRVLAVLMPTPHPEPGAAQRLGRLLSSRARLAFRYLVVSDILSGFFRKLPADGWALVGYARYPGIPGGSRAYVSKPELLQQ